MTTSDEFQFAVMEAERLREQVHQLEAENKRLQRGRDIAHEVLSAWQRLPTKPALDDEASGYDTLIMGDALAVCLNKTKEITNDSL